MTNMTDMTSCVCMPRGKKSISGKQTKKPFVYLYQKNP